MIAAVVVQQRKTKTKHRRDDGLLRVHQLRYRCLQVSVQHQPRCRWDTEAHTTMQMRMRMRPAAGQETEPQQQQATMRASGESATVAAAAAAQQKTRTKNHAVTA